MLKRLRIFWELLQESYEEFVEDHVTKLSASLAYYTIFSIGPLLLVVINILGLFYKKKEASKQVFDQASEFIGKSNATQVQGILDNMDTGGGNMLFGIIGAVVLVYSATSIFTEIQSSINYMWSVKAKPKRGWLKLIRDRAVAFVLIVGGGALMLASVLLNIILDTVTGQLQHFATLQKFLGDVDIFFIAGINTGVLYLIVVVVYAIVFKVLPDARIQWKDAFIGGAFTGVLFLIGKFLITWYLGNSKLISAYGAAASFIILLSWIYYSALILYFGAEFTDVYARKCGRGVTVKKTAVFIIKRESKELPSLKTHVDEQLQPHVHHVPGEHKES